MSFFKKKLFYYQACSNWVCANQSFYNELSIKAAVIVFCRFMKAYLLNQKAIGLLKIFFISLRQSLNKNVQARRMTS